MKSLRILDLFAGIGGFSHAFENVSSEHFKTHAFCEIDKHAQMVLRKHWPMTPIFEDVKTIPVQMFKHRIEIVTGGFPCTDISVAGLKKGLIDEDGKVTRSGLWFEYKRIIKEIRPRWVVIENVRNLLSNGLATVLKDLNEIGYDAEWEIIPASSVGAPHFRERIWIVAYPNSTRLEGSNVISSSSSTVGEKKLSDNGTSSFGRKALATDSDDFRFWPTFTTEEEKCEWWTAATAKFRSRWETLPDSSGVDDGLSKELDKSRAQRIKQLGNSIVPSIVEIIAARILEIETDFEKINEQAN